MPRKPSRSTNMMDKDDDALSQYSKGPDSDDRELEQYAKAVAEFKLTWQKQKREKERKFLRVAQAEMNAHVDRKKRQIEGVVNDMEATYQDFLSKYAAIEDKEREVIVKIADTLNTLVALSVRKHQETIELTQSLEEGQVEGLKQVKQSYQDFVDMLDAFIKV